MSSSVHAQGLAGEDKIRWVALNTEIARINTSHCGRPFPLDNDLIPVFLHHINRIGDANHLGREL